MHQLSVSTYSHATALPEDVIHACRRFPCSSNIIYAHIETLRKTYGTRGRDDLWIVLWNTDTSQINSQPSVAAVLSCTNGPLGAYPIFIFTPFSTELSVNDLRQRALVIAQELLNNIPPDRVFSVFSTDAMANAFASVWTELTGVNICDGPPYYHAYLMYCDERTLTLRDVPPLEGAVFTPRLATEADIDKAKVLCFEFAATSPPFILSGKKAEQEAQILVKNSQLWVHEVRVAGQSGFEIACLVAVTRVSTSVAAITKVYTNPAWRKKGCAERLTRHVCQSLLSKKQTVVLYVGRENPAARVYAAVGFKRVHNAGNDESWKELGFDPHRVKLGHW